MSAVDPAAFFSFVLAGLSPEQQGNMLAEVLPAYVLAWHRLCPKMSSTETGQRFAADAREALARMAEKAADLAGAEAGEWIALPLR